MILNYIKRFSPLKQTSSMKNLKSALQIFGIYYLSALFSVVYAQNADLLIRNYYSQREMDFLYENCPNRLILDLKRQAKTLKVKDLHYQVKNGELILGAAPNEFKIIPANLEPIEIIAKSGETIIASKTLTIKTISPPKVYLSESAKGNPLSLINPISLPEKLYLVAQAQVEASKNLPNEMYYSIKSIEVYLFREGRSIAHFRSDVEELDMTQLKAQSGDGIQVIIQSLQRQTSSGEMLPVPIETPYIGFFVR
jgi:hypothetical protein